MNSLHNILLRDYKFILWELKGDRLIGRFYDKSYIRLNIEAKTTKDSEEYKIYKCKLGDFFSLEYCSLVIKVNGKTINRIIVKKSPMDESESVITPLLFLYSLSKDKVRLHESINVISTDIYNSILCESPNIQYWEREDYRVIEDNVIHLLYDCNIKLSPATFTSLDMKIS